MADLATFTNYLVSPVGLDNYVLPPASQIITDAFNYALDIVHPFIASVSTVQYDLAVYGLGADYVINYAQDQPGRLTFATLRNDFHINQFTPGVVGSTSNAQTASGLTVPTAMQGLQIGDLQNLKTPWGRQYLQIAQMVGPDMGLS